MTSNQLDPIERKRRLFEKANSNLQRRQRESLLSSLPSDLAAYLQNCKCIYTPESHAVISQFYPAWEDGIGFQQKIIPAGYAFTKLGWVENAISMVSELSKRHDDMSAFLMLGAPGVVQFRGEKILVPDKPLFYVSFGWARRECRNLLPATTQSLAFVAEDLSVGVIIDHEWAVIYDPPHPEGVGFEVAIWG